jgi:hypothetical protein
VFSLVRTSGGTRGIRIKSCERARDIGPRPRLRSGAVPLPPRPCGRSHRGRRSPRTGIRAAGPESARGLPRRSPWRWAGLPSMMNGSPRRTCSSSLDRRVLASWMLTISMTCSRERISQINLVYKTNIRRQRPSDSRILQFRQFGRQTEARPVERHRVPAGIDRSRLLQWGSRSCLIDASP